MADITITSFNIANSNGYTGSVKLRVWYTGCAGTSFIDSLTNVVMCGTGGTGSFYKEVTVTVAGGTLTIPAFVLPSTDDSNNINVLASARFYVNGAAREMLFQNYIITNTLGASISFAQLVAYQPNQLPSVMPALYLTAPEISALIAASALNLAVAQDYTIGNYASLAAAVAAMPATGATLVINQSTAVPTNLTVPAYVTLRVTNKGSLTITTAATLTVLGPIEAGPYKIFYNALSGQGTVSFAGNTKLSAVLGEWWGMIGDAAGTGTFAAPGTISGTDSKAMLQAALTAVALGVRKVRVGSGPFLFTTAGKIIIPQNVILEGTAISATSMSPQIVADRSLTNFIGGTCFWITADAGTAGSVFSSSNLTAPCFIQLGEPDSSGSTRGNSCLSGIAFFYPNQLMTAVTPTVYPPTISMRGPNPTVQNVQLINAYWGIDCSYTDRPTIHNVTGQCLSIGLYAARIRDWAHFTNILFNPYWSFFTQVYTWQKNNCQNYMFGKIDGLMANNVSAFGGLMGMRLFSQAADGGGGNYASYPAGGTWAKFEGCEFDGVLWALFVEGTHNPPTARFSNCYFGAFFDGHVGDGDASKGSIIALGLRIRPAADTTIQLNGCVFGGPTGATTNCVEIDTPANLTAKFTGCEFTGWDRLAASAPAINIIGGAAADPIIVNVNSCNFRQNDPQISFSGTGTQLYLTMTGTTYAGTRRLSKGAGVIYVSGGGNRSTSGVDYAVFTSLDTTPSVLNAETFITANAGATTITNFDDASDLQEFTILINDANTTIQDNANVQLAGGVNFVGTLNDIIVLKKVGSTIYEVSRSLN